MMVSIITPNYNSEKYISDMILSVMSQTFEDWELLITDDCSTDNSVNIIKGFVEFDNRIKLFQNASNLGAAISRNNSILNAKGKYIAFLDSDDIWVEHKLETQVGFMHRNNYEFSFTAYFTRTQNVIKNKHITIPLKVTLHDVLKTCSIYTSTVMLRKDILKTGMPDIRRRQDFLTWVNLLKDLDFAYGINNPLMGYNITEHSLSSNKLQVASIQWNCYRKHLKIPFFLSCYYFVNYAFNGFFKRLKQT